jgi:hypothetical protein
MQILQTGLDSIVWAEEGSAGETEALAEDIPYLRSANQIEPIEVCVVKLNRHDGVESCRR